MEERTKGDSPTLKPTLRDSTESDRECNGWANYETWNVALWLRNDPGLYDWAKGYRHHGYGNLALHLKGFTGGTPDGVAWDSPALDKTALDELLQDL